MFNWFRRQPDVIYPKTTKLGVIGKLIWWFLLIGGTLIGFYIFKGEVNAQEPPEPYQRIMRPDGTLSGYRKLKAEE